MVWKKSGKSLEFCSQKSVRTLIKGLLGQHMYIGNNIDPRNVLVEMLHSCTPAANKQYILHSFQSEDGTILVLVATIAFGMGVNCKGVHRVIHYGPSKNIEAYVRKLGELAGMEPKAMHTFCIMEFF